jgi:formimidoylglutamate deiminase
VGQPAPPLDPPQRARYPSAVTASAFLPDLLVASGAVHDGAALVVRGGVVEAVGAPPAGVPVTRLRGAAIVPALASAHGHAFQRAIRGRTQRRAEGRSTFWSWREAMYAAAARLGPDELQAVARLAFHELACAGVAVAGEFHYLHHDPAGRPYADRDELAARVVAAAREVGIRIVLVRASYARGGAARAPEPAQRRFIEGDPAAAVAAIERLRSRFAADPCVSLGVAAHSVRACPAEWIRDLAAEARRRGLPFHVHAAEQPREVSECVAEHGIPPVALLERAGALGPATTAVHAIHLEDGEIAALGRARATVCACPTTERDLGDGVVPADRLLAAGARLALGVDSHAQVDPLEDARAVELDLRLVRGERAVLAPRDGSALDALAARLFEAGTGGGRASLGLAGGRLAPGEPADFAVVDLDDPALAGAGRDDLLALLVFAGGPRAVRALHVAGEPVVVDGRPAPGRAPRDEVLRAFRAALARLRA